MELCSNEIDNIFEMIQNVFFIRYQSSISHRIINTNLKKNSNENKTNPSHKNSGPKTRNVTRNKFGF